MKKIKYEAEKLADGRILSLYRSVSEDGGYPVFEEYEPEKHGWVENLDAKGAFLGEIFTFRVSEDVANDTIKTWEENYKKYLDSLKK